MNSGVKKLLSVFLAAVMLLSAAPLAAMDLRLPEAKPFAPVAKAADYLTSGYCGDTVNGDGTNIAWAIDDDGVLTLTGSGVMGSTPNREDNRVTKVIVGEGITRLADYAFAYCQNLVEVVLPSTLETTGKYSFSNDTALTTIDFGGTREISDYAFSPCWALGEVHIPGTVKTIGDHAFEGCVRLTSVTLNEGIESIGERAFYSARLTEIDIPGSVRTIDDYAFAWCVRLQNVTLHEGLKTIGTAAFMALGYDNENGIKSIVIPDTVETIGCSAFQDCELLESVSLGNGVVAIEADAFSGCDLLTGDIVFPDSCVSVGHNAFQKTKVTSFYLGVGVEHFETSADMNDLDRIDVSPLNENYASYDGVLYNKTFSSLIQIPIKETLNLPAAFPLQNIPDCGGNFLLGWRQIKAVNAHEDSTVYSSADGILYSKDGKTLILCPQGRTEAVVIPDTTEMIADHAFRACWTLGAVHIPGTVKTIGDHAFEGCTRLTSVTLNEGIESIGERAFYSARLTEIDIPGSVRTIDNYAFAWCERLQNVTLHEGLKTIGTAAFMALRYDNENGIKSIVIPDTVETIGCSAFQDCELLESVSLGRSVKILGGDVFSGCDKLKTVYSSECLQTFDFRFERFHTLELLSFPNRYTELKNYGNVTVPASGGVIRGYCGSSAHEMAVKRLYTWESLGHSWLDWYTVTPATFEHDGIERRDCAYCDGYEERVIPQLQQDIYTATFVADGTVVASVDFQKGTTSIEEPAVPARDRYTGRWEDYTLNDADITIHAVYTLITSGDVSDIETESTVTHYTEKDNVLFRLKAYSDAKIVKSVVSQSIPLDIVLVVDQSGSMDDTLGGNVKKVDALKSAAAGFIEAVAANAEMTGADHRIAIAGFGLAGNYSGYLTNENTELLTSSRGIVPYADITPADYAGALVSVSNSEALLGAVNAIEARGATAADLGLEMAKGVFANTDSTGRERVVVFMTDGEPTYTNGFSASVANAAVYNANLLKNAYDALIYSVGVFGSAEANSSKVCAFMNAVSSNYPAARTYTNLGAAASDAFFITVNNTDVLSDVFHTITTESLSHTAPFDNITVIKTLSKYVTLSEPQEQALRVDVMRKYGIPDENITVTRDDQGRTCIRIEGLTPYEVTDDNGNVTYEVAVEFFASLNENAAAAGVYEVDTEDSGVMLGEAVGYEALFETGEITLSSGKNRYIFTINGKVYEITEGGSISACVPETAFSPDWVFSGWDLTGVQSVNGVIVDASLVKAPRTVVWHTAEGDETQVYVEGDILVPPVVPDRADGSKFLSWDRSLPTVMPDADLEFTAVYGPHIHRYVSALTTKATCTGDGLLTYTCVCGDTYTETVAAFGHNYEALTAGTENDGARCTFVCTNCGDRYEYALTYQVVTSTTGHGKVLYEFDLTDDQLETGFQPDGSIDIRVPLSEFQNTARRVSVRRFVDGEWELVPAVIEDGYLVITADHFTPYDVQFVFSCADTGEHNWGEGTVTKDPTCVEEGVRHFVCSICEDEKDEPIGVDPDNHADYGTEVINTAAATCYSDGYTGDTICARCRAVLISGETISKDTVPHAWDEGEVTLKPTCQSTGTVLYRCTVKSCGATKEETLKIDPDGHVFRVTVTEPTCTEGGYTTHSCTLCRYGYTDNATDPLGHTYAIRITPPTCTSGGITTYTCTRCKDSFTRNPTAPVDHVDNNRDGYCDYGCGTYMGTPGGGETQSNCVCGQYHTGAFAGIIIFFHRITYFFRNLFK